MILIYILDLNIINSRSENNTHLLNYFEIIHKSKHINIIFLKNIQILLSSKVAWKDYYLNMIEY